MEATTKAEALMEFCIPYAALTRCSSTMSQALMKFSAPPGRELRSRYEVVD
jgi:hypothetical protein